MNVLTRGKICSNNQYNVGTRFLSSGLEGLLVFLRLLLIIICIEKQTKYKLKNCCMERKEGLTFEVKF